MNEQNTVMNHQDESLESDATLNSQGADEIRLIIRDPDLVGALTAYEAGRPREEFASTALRIGILALDQAQGKIDAGVVRSEGERLQSHEQRVEQKLERTLEE